MQQTKHAAAMSLSCVLKTATYLSEIWNDCYRLIATNVYVQFYTTFNVSTSV